MLWFIHDVEHTGKNTPKYTDIITDINNETVEFVFKLYYSHWFKQQQFILILKTAVRLNATLSKYTRIQEFLK